MEDGARLSATRPTGTPIAAGADGAFYMLNCHVTLAETSPPQLVAYDGLLVEKWRIDLPYPPVLQNYHRCPKPGVVLDKDGIMYLAVEAQDGSYMLAVQTQSPGPAPTPWPLRFGDNHGSNWLTH